MLNFEVNPQIQESLKPLTPELLADKLCVAPKRLAHDPALKIPFSQEFLSSTLEIIANRNALTDKILTLFLSSETLALTLNGGYHLRKFTLASIPQLCFKLVRLDLNNKIYRIDKRFSAGINSEEVRSRSVETLERVKGLVRNLEDHSISELLESIRQTGVNVVSLDIENTNRRNTRHAKEAKERSLA